MCLKPWLYYNTIPDDDAILAFKWKIRRTFNKLQSVNDRLSIDLRLVSVLLWGSYDFIGFFIRSSSRGCSEGIMFYHFIFSYTIRNTVVSNSVSHGTDLYMLIRIQDVCSCVQDDFFNSIIRLYHNWNVYFIMRQEKKAIFQFLM